MVKNDRFNVTFPVIHELLPLPTEDLICLRLPRAWFPYVQGYLAPLKANYPYAGENAKENRDRALKFLELFDGCDVITDLRIQNSRLEAQFCGSETWVLIGRINTIPMRFQNGQIQYDVNGDGTYEISQYINNQQNLYGPGLPVTDDNDRFCRAAWIMANSFADDYADVAKRIDLVLNQIPSRGVQWLSSLTVFPPLIEFIESNIEGITSFIKDWIYGTARDPETIKLVAQILYCSIKDHYPDNLDNVISDLDLGAYEPTTEINPLKAIWNNFNGLAEIAYNTFNGTNTAYLILAYAKVSESAVIEFLGLSTPVEDAMMYALNTAEHFDSRDCGDFPCAEWSHTFEGQELFDFWELFDPENDYAGIWESSEQMWHFGTVPNPDPEVGGFIHRTSLQLKTPLLSPTNIATAVVAFAESSPNTGSYMKWYCDNEDWALDPDKYVPYDQETAEYTLDKSFTRIRFDIAADASFPGEPSAYIRPIQSITLSGQGNDPF